MFARPIFSLAPILIAVPLLLVVPDAGADELPEGIRVTVIAEYESRVPNLESVRLVRVLMEPGSMFDNVEVKNEEYCELKSGSLTHINHVTGQTSVFTVGARWAPPKGDYHTVINNGDELVDMWVYQLIEKGAEAGKM